MPLHHISMREKIIVMLAVMSGLFLVALDQTIIATALGAIVNEFHSFSSLGLVVTAYMLTSTVTVPLAGKLSDMYGRRPILLTGVVIFTLASLLSGLSQNIEQLIAFRAIQGIGGGIIMANAFTIVGDLFSPRDRSKWQGMIGAVFGMSSVIGPLLGGWLTDGQNLFGVTTNWRWTFLINIPIGIIAALVIARYCPTTKRSSAHLPDYRGALLITLALSSLVLAVDNTEMIFQSFINNGISLHFIQTTLWAIAILSTIGFVAVERTAKEPILPLRFFRHRTYVLMSIVTLFFGAAFLGSILYLTQFNQQVFGASASSAGLMLLPLIGGIMISSITIGQLVSRAGRYKVYIMSGIGIAALSILALTTLTPSSPYWHQAIIMTFAGLGLGMAMPILNVTVQNEFDQKDLGAATSSVQLFRGLGSTVGTALLSGILTTGIITSIGNPSDIKYIQTLQQSPRSSQIVGGDITADTLLQINSQRQRIYDGIISGINQSPLPVSAKEYHKNQLIKQQDDFRHRLVNAFADSLRRIFFILFILMLFALVVVSFVKEKPFHGNISSTSSE